MHTGSANFVPLANKTTDFFLARILLNYYSVSLSMVYILESNT